MAMDTKELEDKCMEMLFNALEATESHPLPTAFDPSQLMEEGCLAVSMEMRVVPDWRTRMMAADIIMGEKLGRLTSEKDLFGEEE